MPLKLQKGGTFKLTETTGIKKFVKDLGYTFEQMDYYFKESLEYKHPLCACINKYGGNWRHMAPHQVKQLPIWKEMCMKIEEEKKQKEQESDYIETNLEEILIHKLDNNEEFTPKDCEDFLWSFGEEITEITSESGRWQTPVRTIKKYNNRYFEIDWFKGNTEYQEDTISDRPFEVEPYEKTVIDYKKVNKT